MLWGALMDGDVYLIGQGDAPYLAATWDTFEADAGATVDIVHYSNPWLTWDGYGTAASKVSARGALPLVSLGGPAGVIASVNSGSQDAAIDAWAGGAAGYGLPVYLRLWWEMNGAWFAWGQDTAAHYVTAWKRFFNRVRAIAPNVLFVWCPNVKFSGSVPLTSLYPGDSYVDLVGLDGYNRGTNPIRPDGWRTFSQIFSDTLTDLATLAPSKSVWICETSSSEFGGDKAAWITDAFSYVITRPGIGAFVWFNWNVDEGGRWDWPIESSPAAQAAFAAGVAAIPGITDSATSNAVGPVVASALPPPSPPLPLSPPPPIPSVPASITDCGLDGIRFYQSPYWNFLVTNLDTSGITYLNRVAANRSITYTLNDAAQASLTVPSDNKLVNIPYTDGDPKVDEGVRCLIGFRQEQQAGWVCRFAGIIMQAHDTVSNDVPKTDVTAWDPWRYLDMLPMVNFWTEFGTPQRDQGVRYIRDESRRLSEHDIVPTNITTSGGVADMIIDQLSLAIIEYSSPSVNTYNGLFIDFGQTPFYTGTLEYVPLGDYGWTIQNGTTIGQALRDMCAAGLCDVVMEPVWDPINRPGILAQMSVFYRAGTTMYDVVFGWSRIPQSLVGVDRLEDGTQRANGVLYYQSRGGVKVGLEQDTASQTKYRQYRAARFFPTQGGQVQQLESLATAQLLLRTNGVETITVTPTPERSKVALVDYGIGDSVRVSISPRLRKPLFQTYRVLQIPITVSDDGLEAVSELTLMKFLPFQYIGPFGGPAAYPQQSANQNNLTRRTSMSNLPGP